MNKKNLKSQNSKKEKHIFTPQNLLEYATNDVLNGPHYKNSPMDGALHLSDILINDNYFDVKDNPHINKVRDIIVELKSQAKEKIQEVEPKGIIISRSIIKLKDLFKSHEDQIKFNESKVTLPSSFLAALSDHFSETLTKINPTITTGNYYSSPGTSINSEFPDQIICSEFYGPGGERIRWGTYATKNDVCDINLSNPGPEYRSITEYVIARKIDKIVVGLKAHRIIEKDNLLYKIFSRDKATRITSTISKLKEIDHFVSKKDILLKKIGKITYSLFRLVDESQRNWEENSTVAFWDDDGFSDNFEKRGKKLLSPLDNTVECLHDYTKMEAGRTGCYMIVPLFLENQFLASTMLKVAESPMEKEELESSADEIQTIRKQFQSTLNDLIEKQRSALDFKLSTGLTNEFLTMPPQNISGIHWFADIVGFTSLGRVYDPDDYMYILNTFMNIAANVVNRYFGRVDKIIGDAIYAQFLPIFYGKHLPKNFENYVPDIYEMAMLSIYMTATLFKELDMLTKGYHPIDKEKRIKTLLERKGANLSFRAGVASGLTTVGPVGSKDARVDFTSIGDPVNFAARLESHGIENTLQMQKDTYELLADSSNSYINSTRKLIYYILTKEPLYVKQQYQVEKRILENEGKISFFELITEGFKMWNDVYSIHDIKISDILTPRPQEVDLKGIGSVETYILNWDKMKIKNILKNIRSILRSISQEDELQRVENIKKLEDVLDGIEYNPFLKKVVRGEFKRHGISPQIIDNHFKTRYEKEKKIQELISYKNDSTKLATLSMYEELEKVNRN